MFSRFSRLPLRRCLHTGAGATRQTSSLGKAARIALGATAATATYMTWQLTQGKNEISTDSPRTLNSSERTSPVTLSRPAEAPSEPVSSPSAEADVFIPDAPSDPEPTSSSASESSNSSSDEESTSAEGEGETPTGEAAASGGAFNPVTGEINWDCPCLGGMAHGPCGPEFREAFSCFVFSEAEPKGINCVDKFQNMQNCFRAHPDVYADEIMNDDDED
ncbi:hypothetical protein BDN70DRAFT_783453, partial [Pholiota conissans]